jgi:tRNA(Ile)-lysidine synthase
MIQLQGKLEREVWVACSGGIDSMVAVDFLSRNHKVNVMFFDHGTQTSSEAKEFLKEVYYRHSDYNPTPCHSLNFGTVSRAKNANESLEEYWRNMRYEWFHSFDVPIITCHHLDDCAETWIWSSLNGTGKIIPYANRNVIRPFRLNRKSEFINWARRKEVNWLEDSSNEDTKHMRNFIRHEIMSKALVVNPGLHTVIAKKVKKDGPQEP